MATVTIEGHTDAADQEGHDRNGLKSRDVGFEQLKIAAPRDLQERVQVVVGSEIAKNFGHATRRGQDIACRRHWFQIYNAMTLPHRWSPVLRPAFWKHFLQHGLSGRRRQ